jgi:hypothetical protein
MQRLAGMKESKVIVAIVRNLAMMRPGRLASVGFHDGSVNIA